MGLLWAIEIIKICFVFHTGFYSINLMSEKYGSLLQGFGKEICTRSYMYVPRQTLSIKIKNLKSSLEIRFCVYCLFLQNILMLVISLTVSTYTLCSLSNTPTHQRVPYFPPPSALTRSHTTNFPGMMIQTYLIEFTLQGFTTV